jgi:uncharacterized coiled-coil protein SlyX
MNKTLEQRLTALEQRHTKLQEVLDAVLDSFNRQSLILHRVNELMDDVSARVKGELVERTRPH